MNRAAHAWSYARHEEFERQTSQLPSCYSHPDSVDAWRHRRMLEFLRPLLEEFPGARWMTIGDGRFGSDAHFLFRNGATALATSISDATLAEAKARGFIREYRIENAEHLSASDAAHDFVLCKESYHHFPRPPVAFYEMLRVSGIAVALIEPFEGGGRLLNGLKTLAKKILRQDDSVLFEEAGNFIYRTSIREMEKMLAALNLPCLAYRPFNDFYHPKLASGATRRFSPQFVLTRLGIAVQDMLCSLRLLHPGLTALLAFKAVPGAALRHRLRKTGYRILFMPKNPYR